LRYVILRHGISPIIGSGESLNVSPSGLLFQGDSKTQVGDSVLAAMDWPARGPDEQALSLVVTGYVLRNRNSETALSLTASKLVPAREVAQRFSHFFSPLNETSRSSSSTDSNGPDSLGSEGQQWTAVGAH
jgi:hypothetical protein